jgi:PhnB protein
MSEQPANPAIIPYLIVSGAEAAIDFYVKGFGAVEKTRLVGRDRRIGHAELTIGGAQFMLADEFPEQGHVGPITRGGVSCSFSMQVGDVDVFVARALAAGAKLERPIKDEFYGERVGWVIDPFGHRWSFHQPIEAVSSDTMKQRFEALADQG